MSGPAMQPEHRDGIETTYREHHASRERYGFSYRSEDRGPQLARWVGTGKTILDLGCRDGTLTRYYAAGNQVMGADVDRQALTVARESLGIETTWLDVSSIPLPFASSSFMVVVAAELLEHLPYPQALVRDIVRILTPAGLFVGSVPNAFHWRKRLAFVGGRSSEDPTHLRLFSVSTLRKLLGGFSSLQVLPVGGIGGGVLPIVPAPVSGALIRLWPQMLANGLMFCAVAPANGNAGERSSE